MTFEELKAMKPDTIFASGVDQKWGHWVAVRGGIHDWAIYYKKWAPNDLEVARNGDKLCDVRRAVQLVDADPEMTSWYRL
jgi:hypothetical protein